MIQLKLNTGEELTFDSVEQLAYFLAETKRNTKSRKSRTPEALYSRSAALYAAALLRDKWSNGCPVDSAAARSHLTRIINMGLILSEKATKLINKARAQGKF